MSQIKPISWCYYCCLENWEGIHLTKKKKTVFLCRGEAIHQNAEILLPDRKQTLMLLSACTAFHFTKKFVNYPDSLSLSARAGLDSWSQLLWARNLVFSMRYIAMSHFILCLTFSYWALGHEMHRTLHHNTSNSLTRHCGRERVTTAKSASLPQSIRSVKSISLCMFALVCNNYNLHPKRAW